ncbi:SDR family NAD(P)-dependent oxidoreductase [Staphylospora marina]|uniref:SDR family NAD(P)-dependent oxidoreductase n=1 Tax=Staphylospora marina TaxID=2490858 RepID=UPI000F5C2436|nr:SDR family oxidoreductase [Staphylospora marina]
MNQTVLITGASEGIGKELAKLFAESGHHLVLVARNREKLNRLADELSDAHGVRIHVHDYDLSKPLAPAALVHTLEESGITVDMLINNAGFGLYGEFAKLDPDHQLNMIDLNIRSLTDLTHRLLPGMLQRGHGRIMNVASVAAFQPGPLMAVYYATKAYVLSFSEALANELKGTGVTVTAFCPGPTATRFTERAGLEQSKLFQSGAMTAEEVARIGYKGFLAGKTVIIPGFRNRLLVTVGRFLPRKTLTAIIRQVQERRVQ